MFIPSEFIENPDRFEQLNFQYDFSGVRITSFHFKKMLEIAITKFYLDELKNPLKRFQDIMTAQQNISKNKRKISCHQWEVNNNYIA